MKPNIARVNMAQLVLRAGTDLVPQNGSGRWNFGLAPHLSKSISAVA